jgi:predicted ester cyclase
MRTRENKDLVVRLIEEVWNAGDLGVLPELWAEDTRGDAVAMRDTLTTAFPDLHVEIDDLIAEDDQVAARLTFSGTHRGDFRGIAPTGRGITFSAVRIYRLADGKITGSWAVQDALGLISQLTAAQQ